MKVFLGGTCNSSNWRDVLIPMLDCEYFNPVVDNWDEAARVKEEYEKANDDVCLYVITPEMEGYYGIAQLVYDSVTRPKDTLICFLREYNGSRFNDKEWMSLAAVRNLIEGDKVHFCYNLEEVAAILNGWQLDKE